MIIITNFIMVRAFYIMIIVKNMILNMIINVLLKITLSSLMGNAIFQNARLKISISVAYLIFW